MARARLGTAGIVFVVLLAFPRASSANILDFIWEMSGPQMYGLVMLHCKFYFEGGDSKCKVLDDLLKGKDAVRDLTPREFSAGEFRLAVETNFYWSGGKNSGGDNYQPFRTYMVALEPMLEIGSGRYKSLRFYHGLAGISFDRLFGSQFDSFGKIGWKFRPVGIVIDGTVELDVAFNVRFYPDGFTSDEFGFAPRADRRNERVYGASFGFAW